MDSVLALLIASCALGQLPGGTQPPRLIAQAAPASQPTTSPGAAPKDEKLSDAERIARLQRALDADQARLDELKAKLEDPKSEYQVASDDFKALDKKLADLKEEAQKSKDDKVAAAAYEKDLAALQAQWKLSRDRFNLAIEERKTHQESVAALTQKMERDRGALAKLMGMAPPEAAAEPPVKDAPVEPKEPPKTATSPPAMPTTPESGMPPAGNPPLDSVAPPKGDPGRTVVAQPVNAVKDPAKQKPSPEVVKAHHDAAQKEAAAEQAKKAVLSVTERMKALSESITLEQKLAETARKKAAQAAEEKARLADVLQRKVDAQAPQAELVELRTAIDDLDRRIEEGRRDADAGAERILRLHEELAALHQDQILALTDADQKRREAQAAEKELAFLQNPFAPRNVLRWLVDHGPKLLAILFCTMLLHLIVRVSCARIVRFVASSSNRGSSEECENRAKTLVGVFRNSAAMIILIGGTLMLCDEVNIPVVPLLGGAAVVGLAVAFGAQNLIRDFFSGFMILLEDQYGINDVVTIGSISGLVEKITLRVTVLRDLEGIVHFVPHGTITTVSNMTHGWSRASFDIGIAYKEDADAVMTLLLDLGRAMRRDPEFGPLILDDPEMLGVDAFGDSAVTIKFLIKTRPLKQWAVKREMLRRIKRAFDDRGIEIPFPHRTIYHHHNDGNRRSRDDEMAA